MELNKLKPQDRVIVRVPSDKKGEEPTETEGVILRMDARKTAVVVKFDDGIMRTLPIVNVLRYSGEKPQQPAAQPVAETPAPAPAKPEETTGEGIIDLAQKAEEENEQPVIAKEQPAVVPVSEEAIQEQLDKISQEKGTKPIAETAQAVGEDVHNAIMEGKKPKTATGKKIVAELKGESKKVVDVKSTKSAAEVMEAANQMSQEATQKLEELKGKKPAKPATEITITEGVKKILDLECKKHIKMFKLKAQGFTNKQIADLLETNAGHVWNALKKYEEKPELKEAADKF